MPTRCSLLAGLVLSVMSSVSSFGQAFSSVSTGTAVVSAVYFGTPADYSDACVNRGLCKNSGSATGIGVTFATVPSYTNCLKLTFSLSELQQKQSDQVQYFQSGSYMFDADYCLSSDPMFSSLNLPANSWILTTSNSYVEINGDVVTDYIQYSVVNN